MSCRVVSCQARAMLRLGVVLDDEREEADVVVSRVRSASALRLARHMRPLHRHIADVSRHVRRDRVRRRRHLDKEHSRRRRRRRHIRQVQIVRHNDHFVVDIGRRQVVQQLRRGRVRRHLGYDLWFTTTTVAQ